jgi:hypothetical protein
MKKIIRIFSEIINMIFPRIISAEYNGANEIMTIKYSDGDIEKYSGNCTVWHKLPYMKRCDSDIERWLCDLWSYNQQWGGAYPDAHKKYME